MDALTFLSRLVEHLAWPAALTAVVYMLQDEIKLLVSSLRPTRVRIMDMEAEFHGNIEGIRRDMEALRGPMSISDVPIEKDIVDLLDRDPSVALLAAWKPVEREVQRISVAKLANPAGWPVRKHLLSLVENRLIPASLAAVVEEMAEVSNRAAHQLDYNPSKARVYELIDLMADIVGSLTRIG